MLTVLNVKIAGRVHIAQMKFGQSHFPISITILETSDVDFLFGLDTLRRYRCCIDLGKNCLRIDGSNGVEEVEFLSENQLPERARGHFAGAIEGNDASVNNNVTSTSTGSESSSKSDNSGNSSNNSSA